MDPNHRRPLILVILLLVGISAGLEAQVRVSLQMSKRQYVAHEAVMAVVTLTNHAGRELLIHSGGTGANPVSWLDFSIHNARGANLSPARRVNFDGVRVPAGQSVAKTINLNQVYRVSDLGSYRCHAIVRLPDGGGTFRSNPTHFDVTQARVLYRQRIGVPGTRNVREYKVMIFSASQRSSLYVSVSDPESGRNLQTYSLGEALTFHKPQATVDGKNNLHTLYLTSPDTFTHARINPEGKLLGRDYYRRGQTGTPRLETLANGEVMVVGGVPYDPNAQQAIRTKIRRLSERPAITYQ